ncbi:hypothetical protein A5699_18510 [Mycobacterium sp. E802]|uniref:restriction endonuclease subunit S n=1 Tax=Mycobacterium sp. E802 TaxID=1834152 RepID=UPI0007FE029E|nr:restriction endonuclease subunit S [Mycobacterium sp. E802]OBG87864.1 hypothetical protein A5699_18510 [Mycobacterium sp. E802]
MNWPNYPNYKPSGTEWFSSIPSHWSTTKLKWSTSLVTSGSRGWAQYYAEEGDYFVRIGNLSRGALGFDDSDIHYVQVPAGAEGARTMTRNGDLLFSITAYLGSVAVVDSGHAGAYVSQHIALTRLNDHQLNPWYAGYVALSDTGQRQLSEQAYGGTKIQLSLDDIRSLVLPLPDVAEQQLIADFLDSETAKIDALIAKQEQLVATLREDRAATITHAVTKGLDLDVEMKDSGIEWLGEIPTHWHRTQLRHIIAGIEQGVSPEAYAELADDGWGVLKSGCVNNGVFRDTDHKKLPGGFKVDPSIIVKVGDLLVSRASGSPDLVGSAAIVRQLRYDLILSDKTFRLISTPMMLTEHLEWVLNSRIYREQVRGAISGAEGLANNLPMSALKSFHFPVPPQSEQRQIVSYLTERCASIDALIAKADEVIHTLREYRSALITEAVTGKIDVRGAA